jgi:hypothetical protein
MSAPRRVTWNDGAALGRIRRSTSATLSDSPAICVEEGTHLARGGAVIEVGRQVDRLLQPLEVCLEGGFQAVVEHRRSPGVSASDLADEIE